MTTTEQRRLAADFEEWLAADSDEERERIQTGWTGEKTQTPVLVIPAGSGDTRRAQASEALRAIVAAGGTEGVPPVDALMELSGQGFAYRPTDSELGFVKRAAGVTWTRTGQRGYRWHVR